MTALSVVAKITCLFQIRLHSIRKKMRSVIDLGRTGFRWTLYWVSGFLPRDDKLWIFGTVRDGFSDNALHLFIYVVRKHPKIRAVWVTGSVEILSHVKGLGYVAVHRNSAAGVWLALRARYYFFTHYISDINFFTSRGAILINLWHGSPLKKIEFDVDNGPSSRRYVTPTWRDRFRDFPEVYVRPSYVLSSSQFVSEYALSSAFRTPLSRCLELGYPRQDLLLLDRNEIFAWLSLVGDKLSQEWLRRLMAFRSIILYLPTWRDSGADIFEGNAIDFPAINQLCSDTDSVFTIKLHPFSMISLTLMKWVEKCSHIFFLPSSIDTYALMSATDILVTDYSSVMFEFVLTHRPILLHTFDVESFTALERSFYMPLEEVEIGQITKSADELTEALKDLLHLETRQNYKDEIINRYNKFVDGNACQRTVNYFLETT